MTRWLASAVETLASIDVAPAALVLVAGVTGCAVAVPMACAASSGSGIVVWFAVPIGVLGGMSLVAVEVLRRRHRAAVAAIVERDQEIQRRQAAFEQQIKQRDVKWRDYDERRGAALHEVVRHLVEVRSPAVVSGSPVPPRLDHHLVDEDTAGLLDNVVEVMASAVEEGRERLESFRLVLVALARRVQTAAHQIQETASVLIDRHQADPDVVEGCMRVDHSAAQAGRRAQSLVVLAGEWPGQQWPDPVALVDVVRSAAARITDYTRVEVSSESAAVDVAAAAQVVEPLIHLLAELLDNATTCSPPAAKVTVTVRTVQKGAVIEIDDGGVGLDEHRLEQFREVVDGTRPVGLNEVGEVPRTGLAVIGHLVRRYQLFADLSHSPYGGVRAVVRVPADVVVDLEAASTASARQASAVST